MHVKRSKVDVGLLGNSVGVLAANQPLIVPMNLRLSDLKLRGIVVLVVSKQKGVTLVFKNDPLQQVNVSTTFDSVVAIQRFIQQEIENQLRNVFQEDLPSIIHELSLRWLRDHEELTSGQSSPAKRGSIDRTNSDKTTVSDPSSRIPTRPSSPSKQPSSYAPSAYSTTTTIPEEEPLAEHHLNAPMSPFAPDADPFSLPLLYDEDPYSEYNAPTRKSSTSTTPPADSVGNTSPSTNTVPSTAPSASPFDPLYDESNNVSVKERPIVLRPTTSDFAAHLNLLTSSNHTISPFSLPVEHFTYRSFPHHSAGHDTPITSTSGYAGGLHGSPRKKGKQVKRNVIRMGPKTGSSSEVGGHHRATVSEADAKWMAQQPTERRPSRLSPSRPAVGRAHSTQPSLNLGLSTENEKLRRLKGQLSGLNIGVSEGSDASLSSEHHTDGHIFAPAPARRPSSSQVGLRGWHGLSAAGMSTPGLSAAFER